MVMGRIILVHGQGAGKMSQFEYEITEHVGTLSDNGTTRLELNRIAYNKQPPKLDIRRWQYHDGQRGRMLKGVTLNTDEEAALKAALNPRV